MPNTKTKKFDWQIILAVTCILLVICCATIFCVIGNTEKGVANAQETESSIIELNHEDYEYNRYNILYINQYADFISLYNYFTGYAESLSFLEDDMYNFMVFRFNRDFGNAYYINYPDENESVFYLSTDDGLLPTDYHISYPTVDDLVNDFFPDFARFYVVYRNSVPTAIGYSDTACYYTFTPINRFQTDFDRWSGYNAFIFSHLFSVDGRFTDLDGNCYFKPINTNDNLYINQRLNISTVVDVRNCFSNLAANDEYFRSEIRQTGETGGLLATFRFAGHVTELYYSSSWGDLIFVADDYGLTIVTAYNMLNVEDTNFGYSGFRVNTTYEFTGTFTAFISYYLVSTTEYFNYDFIGNGCVFDWGMLFSSTYNFLNADDVKYLNQVEESYQNGYNDGFSDGEDDGYDIGYSEGYQIGHNAGYDEGYDTGLDAGHDAGYDEGYDAGFEAGYDEGIADFQPQLDELNAELQEAIRERDEYYTYFEAIGWFSVLQSNLNNISLVDLGTYKSTDKNIQVDNGYNHIVVTSFMDAGSSCAFGIVLPRYYGNGTRMRFSYNAIVGSVNGMTEPMVCRLGYLNSSGTLVDIMELPFSTEGFIEFNIAEDINTLVVYTYGNVIELVSFEVLVFSFDEVTIYDTAYNEGFEKGKQQGFHLGRQTGYNEGVLDANDYSFFGLFTAIFDAPITSIVGKWGDSDGDGVYEREGGMLNFYIPGLDINFAPFLLSLFTIAIIVLIIRFILARKS